MVALNAAFFVNAAILIVAAAAFHSSGHQDVALLASGQSSTITGTLAGQVVMEGFLRLDIRPTPCAIPRGSPAITVGGAPFFTAPGSAIPVW